MAFNETLSVRIRKHIGKRSGLVEKKMFGGLAFLLKGNMSVGVHGDEMIVRIDSAESEAALKQKHVRIFDITGKPMKGWILVDAKGLADDKALAKWVDMGVAYAQSLPAK